MLLATFIFHVAGFEKIIFAVKMERVEMPLESQVETRLLIHRFRSAGTVLALDLVQHVCLRTADRSGSMGAQLMN